MSPSTTDPKNFLAPAAIFATVVAAIVGNAFFVRRAERRNPPRGKFLVVDGVRLHYLDRGSGTPIVFLHGNGATAEDFEINGLLDTFSSRHRVIAFDRPGFGYSKRPRGKIWTASAQAELLAHALRDLKVDRPVLVGHSWGTLVALSMALDHDVKPAALVLLSGYYFPTARFDVIQAAVSAMPVIGDLLNHTIGPLFSWLVTHAVFRKMFAPAPISPRFERQFPLALALRPSQLKATAGDSVLMIPAAASLWRRYKNLDVPVVIVAGSGDRIVTTRRQSQRLHSQLPYSELRTIESVGHMVEHSAPGAVAAAIRRAVDHSGAARSAA
jgi:pimeloyl-ACP methyl ester carboxylesterase